MSSAFVLALSERLVQEVGELALFGLLQSSAQSGAEADAVRALRVCG